MFSFSLWEMLKILYEMVIQPHSIDTYIINTFNTQIDTNQLCELHDYTSTSTPYDIVSLNTFQSIRISSTSCRTRTISAKNNNHYHDMAMQLLRGCVQCQSHINSRCINQLRFISYSRDPSTPHHPLQWVYNEGKRTSNRKHRREIRQAIYI